MSDFRPPRPGGIPTECGDCGAPLNAHNITGKCRESKLIARNERLSGQSAGTAESVSHGQAIANVGKILGGRIVADTK